MKHAKQFCNYYFVVKTSYNCMFTVVSVPTPMVKLTETKVHTDAAARASSYHMMSTMVGLLYV